MRGCQAPTKTAPGAKVVAELDASDFGAEAPVALVAELIADPKTWVTLMGMPEGTEPESTGVGSDFKCARDDGKTCWMQNIVSRDGPGRNPSERSKVFSYTTSLTHTEAGAAGLEMPIFRVNHVFTMTPATEMFCAVERVCTDFVQNEMLEVDLGAMLCKEGGMIAQENEKLAELCQQRHEAAAAVA